jgi:sigma-B regulation protein RsbU (phosphoserine phosphatase)
MEPLRRFIMLVDDEPNILSALKRELSDWASRRNLEIIAAKSAPIALELLESRAEHTVLVISDLKMPGMLGSDFLLMVNAKYPEILTMLLTGYSETREIAKAVSAGIFSFMLKPWSSDYLIAEIDKAFLHGETRRENEAYARMIAEELRWAGEMQKVILKPNLPNSDLVEFQTSYQPVPGLYCGGDYYDVIFLGSDRYLLLLGDVAGHGVKAAFVTGILKAIIYPEYIRAVIGKEFLPSAFLSWLNDRMNFEFRSASDMLITFFAGILDLKRCSFRYANAGHEHPFLIRAGVSSELSSSGTGIGIADSVEYEDQELGVLPGDYLLLYTDGLSEVGGAMSISRLNIATLLDSTPVGPGFHDRLLKAALTVSGATDFTDDVTILTARIL